MSGCLQSMHNITTQRQCSFGGNGLYTEEKPGLCMRPMELQVTSYCPLAMEWDVVLVSFLTDLALAFAQTVARLQSFHSTCGRS